MPALNITGNKSEQISSASVRAQHHNKLARHHIELFHYQITSNRLCGG